MANRRTKEQNRAIYERRVARAREQGFKGYGQKRNILAKAKKERERVKKDQEDLSGPDHPIPLDSSEIIWTVARIKAYDRIVKSGVASEEELQELQDATAEEFWKLIRPLMERLSA